MSNKVHALLVGINDYVPPVRPLTGCVNDVDRWHAWLKAEVGPRLAVEVLKNGEATRANVLRCFRSHLGRAEAGDVVLFQYCGHGAQSASAPAFREFYPDGRDEGLVLFDSRAEGGHDLADKELALLIGELAAKDVHVAFVLDSCHSGSGTRSVDAFAGLESRLTLGAAGERELESYLDGAYTRRLAKGQSLRTAPGRHMLLAACNRTQEAKESRVTHSGIFSTTMMEVLESSGGAISYADLFTRCRALVRKRAVDQDPQFEPIGHFDAWSGFLGGAGGQRALRHSVFFDGKAWKIDAGAIHGLGDETDRVIGVELYDEADPSRSVGSAHTVEVGAQQSVLELDLATAPSPDTRFRAAITSLPAPPLLVYCTADAALRQQWQQTLDGAGAPLAASGVLLTDQPDGVRHELAQRKGRLALIQREGGKLLRDVAATLRDKPNDLATPVLSLLQPLRTIAQWERLLALRNRASQIAEDSIDFVCTEPASGAGGSEFFHEGGSATLESAFQGGEWQEVKARLKVRNRSGRELHLVLAYFSPDYGIQILPTDPLPAQDEWVTLYGDADDEVFRLIEGRETEETIDRFKLILSTEPVDGFQLAQAGLDEAVRAIGSKKKKPRSQDWLTKDLRIRVVPRIAAVGDKPWASSDGAVVVRPHRRLRAQLNLSHARPASRGPGEGLAFVEALERAGLSVASLSSSRAVGDAPSVIELSGIEHGESLADEPLEIALHQPLGADEALLGFTWDGQHVLPCGDSSRQDDGSTLVRISSLPPTPSDRRSLGGSLKLYFFKTYLKQTHLNRLRWVEFKPDGSWAYRNDGVAAKVAAAQRVLLMVHGIIGDTEGMAAGAQACGLNERFDLVLTYDYENLSTPIAETARQLKAQLAEAGLKANDGRHLTLLVHSMGGLVSRWFIEREGGAAVVDHLVMCGTPNNGSPFGRIDGARKIFSMLLGLAANYVPALIPFTAPVLLLLNRSGQLTPTLEQMNPDSDFIRELNSSADPGIPYTILAGDVDSYQEPTDELFAKLIAKTGRSALFDLLFANSANDIACSIASITEVGAGRARPPQAHQVACHHLNYFVSPAGQQALRTVAW